MAVTSGNLATFISAFHLRTIAIWNVISSLETVGYFSVRES